MLDLLGEDFGYVKVHKIALLVVLDMVSYNFFLGGWHVFKANMTTLEYRIIGGFGIIGEGGGSWKFLQKLIIGGFGTIGGGGGGKK